MSMFRKLIGLNAVAVLLLTMACCKKDTVQENTPLTFFPASGIEGTEVTLTGRFSTAAMPVVKFGESIATEIISANDTEIKVKVPQHAVPGIVKISVNIAGEEIVSEELFTVKTNPVIWMKRYGAMPKGDEDVVSIVRTADGGYVMLSQTYIYSPPGSPGDVTEWKGFFDLWILKIDKNGNKQWDKTIGGGTRDDASTIIECTDGNYAIAGRAPYVSGDITDASNMWVAKISSNNGAIIWQKAIAGGTINYIGNCMKATSDGGLVVVGTDNDNMLIAKLDGNGNISWRKSVGDFVEAETARAVTLTPDGGYVMVGESQINNNDVKAVKLSTTGDVVWQKTMGGSMEDMANCVTTSPGGGYIVAGFTKSSDGSVTGYHGGTDIWVVKLDESGNMIWQKAFGGAGSEEAKNLITSNDNQFVMVGTTTSHNNGDVGANNGFMDFWVVKFTPDGKLTDQVLLGTDKYEWGSAITNVPGTGYLVAGAYSRVNGGNAYTGWEKDALVYLIKEPN